MERNEKLFVIIEKQHLELFLEFAGKKS